MVIICGGVGGDDHWWSFRLASVGLRREMCSEWFPHYAWRRWKKRTWWWSLYMCVNSFCKLYRPKGTTVNW